MFASKKYVQDRVNKLAELVVDVNADQTRALHREIARLESRIAGFAVPENSGSSKSTKVDSGTTRVIWLSEVPENVNQVALVRIIRAYCGGTLRESRDLVLKAMQRPSSAAVVLDPYVFYVLHSPKLDPNYVVTQLTELGCAARVVELR